MYMCLFFRLHVSIIYSICLYLSGIHVCYTFSFIYIYIYTHTHTHTHTHAYHIFFPHSSPDWHLVTSISYYLNNAGMNIGVNVSFIFIDIHSIGIARTYVSSIFNFWGTSILYSIVAASLPTMDSDSLFCTSSPTFVSCSLSDNSHSEKCEVISHCGFDLHFSN